jgi:uncharacterized protein YgbK (DUF1537 family)
VDYDQKPGAGVIGGIWFSILSNETSEGVPMQLRYGIVADDLSGGMNIGVEFSSVGLSTMLVQDEHRLVGDQPEVLILDTETRHESAEVAYRRTFAAAQVLRKYVPDVVVKKIDSLLRGQIGMEVTALKDVFGFEKCLFIAASPKLGRRTAGGYHYVGNYLLEMVRAQVDPSSTVEGSHILSILAAQTDLPLDLIDTDTIRQGGDAIRAKIIESAAAILVSDCADQNALDLVVESAYAAGIRFFAGTYGLGEALVRLSYDRERPILFVVGSLSATAYVQVNHMVDHLPCQLVRIEYDETFLDMPVEAFAASYAGQLQAALMRSPYVVLQTAGLPDQVERLWQHAVRRNLDRDAVSQRIDRLLQHLVEPVLPGISGLVATGGSTANSVFSLLNADGLQLQGDEVLPGTPGARVVGGPYGGLPFVAKPGSQGNEDALVRLAQYVQKASVRR